MQKAVDVLASTVHACRVFLKVLVDGDHPQEGDQYKTGKLHIGIAFGGQILDMILWRNHLRHGSNQVEASQQCGHPQASPCRSWHCQKRLHPSPVAQAKNVEIVLSGLVDSGTCSIEAMYMSIVWAQVDRIAMVGREVAISASCYGAYAVHLNMQESI